MVELCYEGMQRKMDERNEKIFYLITTLEKGSASSLKNIRDMCTDLRKRVDSFRDIERRLVDESEERNSEHLFLDIRSIMNDFLENLDYNGERMDFSSLKDTTMMLISDVVESTEKIERNIKKKESTSKEIAFVISDHISNLRKNTITIDSSLNALKESQNYILENLMRRTEKSSKVGVRPTSSRIHKNNRSEGLSNEKDGMHTDVIRSRSQRRSSCTVNDNKSLKIQIEKLRKKVDERKKNMKLIYDILKVKERECENLQISNLKLQQQLEILIKQEKRYQIETFRELENKLEVRARECGRLTKMLERAKERVQQNRDSKKRLITAQTNDIATRYNDRLMNENKELRDLVSKLEEELSIIQAEMEAEKQDASVIENLRKELKKLKSKVNDLEMKLEIKEGEIEDVTQSKHLLQESYEKRIRQKDIDLDQITSQMEADFKKSMDNCKSESKRTHDLMTQNYEELIRDLQQDLSETKKRCDKLNSDIMQQKLSLKSQDKQIIEGLEEKANDFEYKLGEEKTKHKKTKEYFEKKLGFSEEESNKHKKEAEKLKKQLIKQQSLIEQQSIDHKHEADNIKASLESQIAYLEEESNLKIREADKTIEKLKGEISALKESLKTTEDNHEKLIESLKSSISKQKNESIENAEESSTIINKLNSKIHSLEEELDQERVKNKGLLKIQSEKQEEIHELASKAKKFQLEASTLKKEIQSQIPSLEEELEKHRVEHESKNKSLQEKIANLQDELIVARSNHQEEIAALIAESAKTLKSKLEEKDQQYRNEIELLRSSSSEDLSISMQKIAALKENIEELKDNLYKAEKTYEKQAASSDLKLMTLKEENSQLIDKVQNLKDEIKSIEKLNSNKFTELQKYIDLLEADKEELENEVKDAQNLKNHNENSSSRQIDSYKAKIELMNSEKEELQNKVKTLKEKIDKIEKDKLIELDKQKECISALRSTLETRDSELEIERSQNSKLLQSISNLEENAEFQASSLKVEKELIEKDLKAIQHIEEDKSKKLDDLNSLLEEEHSKIKLLEREIEEKTITISKLQEDKENISSSLKEERLRANSIKVESELRLEEETSKLKLIREELEKKLEEEKSNSKLLAQASENQLKEEILRLKTITESSEKKLEEEKLRVKLISETSQNKLAEEMAKKDAEIERLQLEAQEQESAAMEIVESMTNEKYQVIQELEEEKTVKQELETEIKKLQKKSRKLNEVLSKFSERYLVEGDLSPSETISMIVKSIENKLSKTCAENQDEISSLRAKLEEMTLSVTKFEDLSKDLSSQNTELKKLFSEIEGFIDRKTTSEELETDADLLQKIKNLFDKLEKEGLQAETHQDNFYLKKIDELNEIVERLGVEKVDLELKIRTLQGPIDRVFHLIDETAARIQIQLPKNKEEAIKFLLSSFEKEKQESLHNLNIAKKSIEEMEKNIEEKKRIIEEKEEMLESLNHDNDQRKKDTLAAQKQLEYLKHKMLTEENSNDLIKGLLRVVNKHLRELKLRESESLSEEVLESIFNYEHAHREELETKISLLKEREEELLLQFENRENSTIQTPRMSVTNPQNSALIGDLRKLKRRYDDIKLKLAKIESELESSNFSLTTVSEENENLKHSSSLMSEQLKSLRLENKILLQNAETTQSMFKHHMKTALQNFLQASIYGKDKSYAHEMFEFLTSLLKFTSSEKDELLDIMKKGKTARAKIKTTMNNFVPS